MGDCTFITGALSDVALANPSIKHTIPMSIQYSPEVHSLHTDGAVPQTREGALLLRSTGLGALEAEALGARPAERPGSIAERKASVVDEAESHTR